jgi:hypothetical protein
MSAGVSTDDVTATTIAEPEERSVGSGGSPIVIARSEATKQSCTVIPGWSEGPDPESRDSGFDASHRPGMTEDKLLRSARNDEKDVGRPLFRLTKPIYNTAPD